MIKIRIRFFVILLCVLFVRAFAFAQQSTADSLIRLYNKETKPHARALLARQISKFYSGVNQTLTLEYINKALTDARKGSDDTLLGDLTMKLATVYYMNGDFDQARTHYFQGVEIYRKSVDKSGTAIALSNVGLTYINQGRLSEGLKYQFEALAIYDSIQNEQGVSRCYNAIAVVYNELGNITKDKANYDNALVYLRKSVTMSLKVKDSTGYNYMLTNIGNVFRATSQFDSAMYYYKKAETIAIQRKDVTAESTSLGNMADVYLQQKNHNKAIEVGEKALSLKQQLGDQLGQTSMLIILAECYLATEKNKKAFEYLQQAYELAQKTDIISEQATAARLLAKQYSDKGDYFEAWKLLDAYATIRDSITAKENKQLVTELQRFTFEDQKKQIELLTQKNQIVELKSTRQSQLLMFSVIGFVLLLVIAVMIYSRFLVKKRANTDLQKAYSTIEEKNKSITDSIRYAKNLQEAILPSQETIQRLLPESFVLYKPKDIVAGDFYWVETYNDLLFFAAADCTGHGVPGAMVSVVCSKALQGAVFQYGIVEPGAILDKATELVLETFARNKNEVNDGMDISLACWNPKTRELKWAGAYNPLLLIASDTTTLVPPDKQPVGRMEKRKPFTTHVLSLKEKSMLYLFTDGYADQFGGEKGKKLKQKNLLERLQKIAHHAPDKQQELLEQEFTNWKGDIEQVDDVLILGVRI
ncbi:MAG: tetratricopeptide repeat protein [Bacteroidia bacterium]